ncbi:hypothetical protein [Thermomonospora echinospora]|uniref:hypothetical protein n=1 Tax=Thermomonospora echinospora TaxID=1992 RepID=UPI0011B02AA1|nr:hypothetical protein [Thermomonospora echinospora]
MHWGLAVLLIGLSGYLSLVGTGPVLWTLALVPAVLGMLLATWVAVRLNRRAAVRGGRIWLDGLLIFLAGLSPALTYLGLLLLVPLLQ